MKNLTLLIIFTIFSAVLLVIMLVLAFLPKICSCFNTFCIKNHEKLALQKKRAQMIKQARLKIAYKSQIMHEAPSNEELDVSRGIFFDEDAQQKFFDKASMTFFKKDLHQNKTLQSKMNDSLVWLNGKMFEAIQIKSI